MKQEEKFIQVVQQIVRNILEKMGLLVNEWHLGTVYDVNEDGTLNLFIDGSYTLTPSVPANPDLDFLENDLVWVHFVNRNPNNLFVPYRRLLL